MRNIVDPKQTVLFEPGVEMFSPVALQRLQQGWQGLFRHALLELMPADALADHFDERLGRPTKELYSMAGLMFLMEFNDWTCDAAVEAYLFRMDVHYALNLGCCAQSMTMRTVERYRRVFRENGLAQNVMDAVTAKLVQLLELDVEKQRLDSTHIFSNMARFGRSQLMATTVRRFLHQLKRHDPSAYDGLPEGLRERYAKSEVRLFGDAKKKGKQGSRRLRQQIAEDMAILLKAAGYNLRQASRTRKARAQVAAALRQSCHAIVQMLPKRPLGHLLRLTASRIGPLRQNARTLAPACGFALSTIT